MINKLILGTVQLGLQYGINNDIGQPSLANAIKILETAFDNGINLLDTAEAYGNSQEIIGVYHKQHPKKIFNVITKLSSNHTLKKNELEAHIIHNCTILNVKQLYGYMFHNYASFKDHTHFYGECLNAKRNGIIQKAGISLYGNNEVLDIIENYPEFDFIQIPFNLFDNATKRKEILSKAKKKGVEIHTRSAFLQGLFFKKSDDLPKNLTPLKEDLNVLERLTEKTSIKIESLALQYVLQKQYIDHVLIGVDSVNQLLSNLANSREVLSIPSDIIDTIDIKNVDLLNPSNW